jgi:exosortase N
MISTLSISSVRRSTWQPVFLFIAAYWALAGFTLYDYLPFGSLRFVSGVIALWFVLDNDQRGERSYRYAWVAGVFFVLCLLLPVKTFLFFTISFSLLFLVEYCYGKMSVLPAIVIILLSPLFKYAADTFSFPLRLQLTNLAGSAFSLMGYETIVKGNVIIHSDQEFSVDPGCMGLNMMETSLLFGVIIIAGKLIKQWKLWTYLLAIVLLNITANFFRILILVQFSIPPGSVNHDIVGLLCLLIYVILPSIAITRYIAKNGGKPTFHNYRFTQRDGIIHSAILGGIVLLAVYVSKSDTYSAINEEKLKQVNGYDASVCAPGIVKLKSSQSLIYLKYIRGFYDTDHNPMICWKGSGFSFESVEKQKRNGFEMYTAMLVNGKEKLYSAWWYSNGTKNTASQFVWRWNMLSKREKYALVNVTCATKEELDKEIRRIEGNKSLSSFFQ